MFEVIASNAVIAAGLTPDSIKSSMNGWVILACVAVATAAVIGAAWKKKASIAFAGVGLAAVALFVWGGASNDGGAIQTVSDTAEGVVTPGGGAPAAGK